MKRIVICCDGTWNRPDDRVEGVACPTNVVKIALAVTPHDPCGTRQILYYDPGIGTSGSWPRRCFDAMTGTGISQNIREAYRFLVLNYEAGDEIFLFGFSRGAFTVRSLAGFIATCGILRTRFLYMTGKAYTLYRSRKRSTHPREKEATLFRKSYAVADQTRIQFIGVWDTVGALGNPLLYTYLSPRNRFHDTDLSSSVDCAYHAVAIDERRGNFRAALFGQQGHATGQVLEQVWFAGVHSDVGGGYAQTGLSDIALDWMVGKATARGLGLVPIPADPAALAPRHESRKSYYLLLPWHHRPIGGLSRSGLPTHQSLHPSVVTRYLEDPAYRPKNLVEYIARNPGALAQ